MPVPITRYLATVGIMMIMTANTSTADTATETDSAITIYSTARPGAIDISRFQGNPYGNPAVPGYAMIKQERVVPLKKGRTELKFSDVTAGIDPTTVQFSTPDHPGIARVLDQNYQFDIVSTQKLMNRYLGQKVRVSFTSGNESGWLSGSLLGTNGGLIIQKESGEVVTLNRWDKVNFPSLPGGLLTRPTLVWLLDSKTNGPEKIRVTYQSTGMTWWADYNIVLDESDNGCHMDLSAWVSLINQSGAEKSWSLTAVVALMAIMALPRIRVHTTIVTTRARLKQKWLGGSYACRPHSRQPAGQVRQFPGVHR